MNTQIIIARYFSLFMYSDEEVNNTSHLSLFQQEGYSKLWKMNLLILKNWLSSLQSPTLIETEH